MTAFELGSDIGGSIRVPAHFCGIYGHKPSYGIVPRAGHIPPPPGALYEVDLAVAGPMARSAADLELAMDVLVGPSDLDAPARPVDLPAARHNQLRDFRVALWADADSFPLDSPCRIAIEDFANDLRGLGVTVDEKARPEIAPRHSYDVYLNALFGIVGAGVPEQTLRAFADADENASANRYYEHHLARAVKQSFRDWIANAEEREKLFRRWRDFFGRYDVLICPITPTVAFPHDTGGVDITAQFTRTITVDGKPVEYLDNLAWPGLITVANLPATAIPTRRFVGGLPVGVQVVGPYLEDRTPLAFARLVSERLGGFIAPPV